MAERPRIALVKDGDAAPFTLSIDELKAQLVTASAERADACIAQLQAATAEANYLAGLDYLPAGERDRFRRIAFLNSAELDGLEALRQRRGWTR